MIVTRTFSKVYGIAGLRLGFAVAHADTVKKMVDFDDFGPAGRSSFLALRAGIAAMQLDPSFVKQEAARNREVLDYTRAFFKKAGYKDTETQANCVFVDLKRPCEKFAAACRAKGVLVGRPFPPYTNYTRVTIGTMEEMQRATGVFTKVLAASAAAA